MTKYQKVEVKTGLVQLVVLTHIKAWGKRKTSGLLLRSAPARADASCLGSHNSTFQGQLFPRTPVPWMSSVLPHLMYRQSHAFAEAAVAPQMPTKCSHTASR